MVRANAVLPRARSGTATKGEKGSVVSPKTQWLPALRFSHFRVQLETNTRVRPTAGLMLMAAKATCTRPPGKGARRSLVVLRPNTPPLRSHCILERVRQPAKGDSYKSLSPSERISSGLMPAKDRRSDGNARAAARQSFRRP